MKTALITAPTVEPITVPRQRHICGLLITTMIPISVVLSRQQENGLRFLREGAFVSRHGMSGLTAFTAKA